MTTATYVTAGSGASVLQFAGRHSEKNMLRNNKSLEKNFGTEAFQTLIGRNANMEGRITFSDGIRIDGRITGDISVERGASGSIAIGPDAQVQGNISAQRVLIAGTVIGDIHASQSVHLLASARVTGDIAYAQLSISPGAQVNGTLHDVARSGETAERPGNLIRLADKTLDAALQADRG
jgi:cytoskeletal protein CcmA (bactofilin family)